jgi:hypothetical protein
LYHILPDCFKPYKDLISFTQYMLWFVFVFGIEIPSGTFMYISESNNPYKYAVTTSINCKDRCFCIARDIRYHKVIPFITREYVLLKLTLGLYVKPYATSLVIYITTSLFSFSFLNKNPLEPKRKGSVRCWHHFSEHLSFLKQVKLSFNCIFPLVLV